jgi:hypothetical protein
MYPGWSFQWQLAAAVTKADFADADRDGRAKLSAYVFGPGDKMQVDTFVYVRRKAAGEYEIRANVPFTLGLPKANFLGAQISNDGKTYRPVATPQPGVPAGQMRLNTEDLGNGTVFLKLAA